MPQVNVHAAIERLLRDLPERIGVPAAQVLREVDARVYAAWLLLPPEPSEVDAAREFGVEDVARWAGQESVTGLTIPITSHLTTSRDPVAVLEMDVVGGDGVRRRVDRDEWGRMRVRDDTLDERTYLRFRIPAEAWREPVASVEVERVVEPDGRWGQSPDGTVGRVVVEVHASVAVTTKSGRVYDAPVRRGETPEDVRDRYLAQGHTDEGCVLRGPAPAPVEVHEAAHPAP